MFRRSKIKHTCICSLGNLHLLHIHIHGGKRERNERDISVHKFPFWWGYPGLYQSPFAAVTNVRKGLYHRFSRSVVSDSWRPRDKRLSQRQRRGQNAQE